MPEQETNEDFIAKAEKARDAIATELKRLQAQLKGMETKIAATEAKLQGANDVVEAMRPKKGTQ